MPPRKKDDLTMGMARSILTTVALLLLGYVAWLGNKTYDLNGRMSGVEAKLSGMETSLASLRSSFTDIRLKQLSADPSDPANIQEVRKLLDVAIAEHTRIDPKVVSSVGAKFVQASAKNPEAWTAALSFLRYRSVANSGAAPRVAAAGVKMTYEYSLTVRPNPDASPPVESYSVTELGQAAPEDSARLESLSKPNPKGSGVKYLLVEGRANIIVLDRMWMKDVIIRDAVVEYDGGPVRLEHVFFVNCTFQLQPSSPRVRDLGLALLTSTPTSFASV